MTTGCVIIAEDESLIALAIGDIMEMEGYSVQIAANGEEALSRISELSAKGLPPDILITDLNMPIMSGEDLIRNLSQTSLALPVIVMTGSPPTGGLDELRKLGEGNSPYALLSKPIDFDHLLATVQNALHSVSAASAV